MAYNNTGQGHRTAVADELRFSEWLNNGGHQFIDFGGDVFERATNRGGTTTIEDVVAHLRSGGEVKFSCKLASGGLDSHSHTYKNTSSVITRLKRERSSIVAPILQLEEYRDAEVARVPSVEERRRNRDEYACRMTSACEQTRNLLSPEIITAIFAESMAKSLEADWVVLSDMVARQYLWYRPEDHPAIGAIEGGYSVRLACRPGSESASVLLVRDGQELSLGLRLRVKHNNGVSDLFRMGTQNNGSFVTTIQQDPGSVPRIIDIIEANGKLFRAPMRLS